ncbi:hypothetical protein FOCG_11837 [Fusarium oxysporum f. sp. radicis-lycopersici 26381]|nr:hypothetical protein FOWG_12022 [Fusarium oxysporum f. sp. lycopersici MN25]EXL47682.1 hypothetical protein FOCG_11837 [Fusarium oxysporum f. sp. radicis-lycopersici 26381]
MQPGPKKARATGLYCNRLRHHITAVLAGVYCSTTKNARRLPDLVKVGICPDNLHKPRHMLNGLGQRRKHGEFCQCRPLYGAL